MDTRKAEKYKELEKEHKKIVEKLEYLYRGFRGVSHENSAAEMRYTTIRVYEAHLRSIEAEMKTLKKEG